MKLIKYLFIVIVFLGLIVAADYFSLLGTKTKKVLDFSEIRFKPIDINTNRPIYSARAICYRHGNRDICTIKDSGKPDIVSAQFPVHKILTLTWLFQKSEEYILPKDPNIKIMLIHNDYHSVSGDYNMKDIHANSGQLLEIKMEPKNWGESSQENAE